MKLNTLVALPVVAAAIVFATSSLNYSPVGNSRSMASDSSGRSVRASSLSSSPASSANGHATAVKAGQRRKSNPALVAMITDNSQPLHVRPGALREILASGTRSEVFDALAALADPASNAWDTALLGAEFTSPMSNVALDAVADLLAGLAPEAPSTHALPTEVADGIRKGLQSQQDLAGVGQTFERAWRRASPDGRQRLESQEIPDFFARRAAALIADDPSEALLWMARLETCAHPRTPESVFALSRNPAMSVAELSSVLYNWSRRHAGPETSKFLNQAMTDPALNTVQQGISALGLAGTSEALSHVPAMQKAASQTNDPWLQNTLNYAIELAQENQALK